ncbi:hypothetical protein [Streptomyces sp. NPDC029674]|uniref:hypothetical protein n=1 Tax=Streptomyces sp. NPDC029674 TaxID=3365297 RepID=UPI0038512CC3
MLDTTTEGDAAPPENGGNAAPAHERRPAAAERHATDGEAERPTGDGEERQGCLFALSQPPLMIFLAVISTLILVATLHDLLLL